MSMLTIENLTVSIGEKKILKNLSIEFKHGEIHAIMGRNGCGKSTLSKVIAGHPAYSVDSGDIMFLDKEKKYKSLLELAPEERAAEGLFIGFQNPVTIKGLDNESFLRTIYNHSRQRKGLPSLDSIDFREYVLKKMDKLGMSESFLSRGLNEGFSGGERKKNEMLQLELLEPRFCMLDEIDSGLDVDALHGICQDILNFRTPGSCFIFVTHYNRILKHIKPDYVHVIHEGQIILSSSDATVAHEIEEHGFNFLIKEKTC